MAATWLGCPAVRAWYSANLDQAINYGKGSAGAELVAQMLQDKLASESGFVGTLDWTQAYDRMRPQVTVQVLQRLGWPPKFCSLLSQAWGGQQRWVMWSGEVLEQPVAAGQATPQGCPLAPLILGIWATAGVRGTRLDNVENHIYMDDRSFYTTSLPNVQLQIGKWQAWSAKVGLRESPNKTKVVARGKSFQDLLPTLPSDWTDQQNVRILGAVTVNQTRQYHPAEEERIQTALQRATLQQCVPLPWDRALTAHGMFVNSVVAYGWVGRSPKKGTIDTLFRQFSKTAGQQARSASNELRRVVYGAKLELGAILLQRQLKRVNKLRHDRALPWANKPWTAVGNFRRTMKSFGWQETAPWTWSVAGATVTVGLPPDQLSAMLHDLRVGWREFQFKQFLHSGRREARGLLERYSFDVLLRHFRCIDLERLRREAAGSAWFRNVAMAACFSHAAFANPKGLDKTCPFCSRHVVHVGTFVLALRFICGYQTATTFQPAHCSVWMA